GHSAVGTSVLAVKGWIINTENEEIYLRHDLDANMSLISQEYYHSLKGAPPVKRGCKLKLWKLTDKNSELEGYVRLPVIMKSELGFLIETTVEAYVVPNMMVPILLGEDYQLDYEISTLRDVKEGCQIVYKNDPTLSVKATQVKKTSNFKWLHASVHVVQSFVKACNHCRSRNLWNSYNIKVAGPFDQAGEWIVEHSLTEGPNSSFLAIPNILINSEKPLIPVANMSSIPQMIRKGDVLGRVQLAKDFLDKLENTEQEQHMSSAALIASKLAQL
ncbi:hypothetical protein IW262DRAFT_1234411, partial [Armillaria fumosa]